MLRFMSSLNGAFDILLLLAIFGAVGFVAYYIRKTFYPAPWDNKKVDPKTAAKEELERVLVPLDQPLKASEPKEPVTQKPIAKKTTAKKTTTKRRSSSPKKVER